MGQRAFLVAFHGDANGEPAPEDVFERVRVRRSPPRGPAPSWRRPPTVSARTVLISSTGPPPAFTPAPVCRRGADGNLPRQNEGPHAAQPLGGGSRTMQPMRPALAVAQPEAEVRASLRQAGLAESEDIALGRQRITVMRHRSPLRDGKPGIDFDYLGGPGRGLAHLAHLAIGRRQLYPRP